jgi:hypothetical protein
MQTAEHKTHKHSDAGVTDVLGSMVGLMTAGTQFSVEQVQNAATLFTDPRTAMTKVRDSMDNLAHAMTGRGGRTGGGHTESHHASETTHERKA